MPKASISGSNVLNFQSGPSVNDGEVKEITINQIGLQFAVDVLEETTDVTMIKLSQSIYFHQGVHSKIGKFNYLITSDGTCFSIA